MEVDGKNESFDFKDCLICKRRFRYNTKKKRDREKRTCSQPCSAKLGIMNSKKVEVKCKICQDAFMLPKHNVQKDGNFCSDRCRSKRHENKCVVCETLFRSDRAGVKYCGQKCQRIGIHSKTIVCVCACCQIEFERSSFTVASNKRVFCSKACGQRQFARENPNRYGSNWSRIRERKVKADNYRCNRCKEQHFEPYSLNVHHIVPIDNFENLAEANQEENLETLCFECHMKHHDREIVKK